MKTIKVVDEETLEMRDMVITDDGEIAKEPVKDITDEVSDACRQALPCDPTEFMNRYTAYKTAKAKFDEVFEPYKANLLKLHETTPSLPKNIIVGGVKTTYVAPSTRQIIDSKKLKEEEPELAKKFTKISNVRASIRLEEI